MHKGIDVANNVGTPIVAARSGEVVVAGWDNGGYGYLVELRHADGSRSRYAHNSRILVRVGQSVNQGSVISQMGSTGRSQAPSPLRNPPRGRERRTPFSSFRPGPEARPHQGSRRAILYNPVTAAR